MNLPDSVAAGEADDQARRAYWSARMDEADEFMRLIMDYPVEECCEPMELLTGSVRSAGVEIAFSDLPHANGQPRLYFLRRSLVAPFLAAARELNSLGLVLKVEDAYRTLDMQRALGRMDRVFKTVVRLVYWECQGKKPAPELLLRRLGGLVALAPKIGTHMSGSAMDVSLLSREDGREIDRGGPYIELSEKTPMESPYVSELARENRRALTALMARHGFTTYPWEFWHYNAGDAYEELLKRSGRPARYGAVHLDQASGKVSSVERPTELLNSQQDIKMLLEKVLSLESTWGGSGSALKNKDCNR